MFVPINQLNFQVQNIQPVFFFYDNPHHPHSIVPRREELKTIGNYTLIKRLGGGAFGNVMLGIDTFTGKKLAVKIVDISRDLLPTFANKQSEPTSVQAIREASMMKLMCHTHIGKVYEMSYSNKRLYMFLEYVKQDDLHSYKMLIYRRDESKVRELARQMASALDYCHRNSIVHRDLKPDNIVLGADGTAKVVDFGIGDVYSPHKKSNFSFGTIGFIPPEMLYRIPFIGPEGDVWSFGVVLYYMLTGINPFEMQTNPLFRNIPFYQNIRYPSNLSKEVVSLLKKMFEPNPTKRITMSEVIVHPWMNMGYSGIVHNQMPIRETLQTPLDINVIRGMGGIGLGNEKTIIGKLKKAICCEGYQRDAAQYQTIMASQVNGMASPKVIAENLVLTDVRRMPFLYDPMISIYHLVKEKQEAISESSFSQPDILLPTKLNPLPHAKTNSSRKVLQKYFG